MSFERPGASAPSCTICPFRQACRHAGGDSALRAAVPLAPGRVRLRAGDVLYAQGRPTLAVFPVRTGGLKQVYESRLGWRQVSGFFQCGDVCGLEPNESAAHGASAVALQDTECCTIPIEALHGSLADPALRVAILASLRQQAGRQAELMVAIGSMKASQRLAMLLLDLSAEQARRGIGDGGLTLAMTRNDIASYLGLTLETVSRLLSRFRSVGLITVRHRMLRIVDPDGLADVYADPDRVALRGPGD
ncbi:CRP/FNR family transcriptional regulator, anaerobic regulatory protein [Ralstonia sp. 25mfcol4.1]|uniref:Crp/Fnr family transcriptional regulator n=1 Tax=Burkholderiaceae TaxID=119060 RepID=UPI00087F09F6|nr:helix-turn-helix domain-containing protein [Ralstonia sp. 25mfcol4.1]SDP70083.1 CRP/FNR family transcriptional regulator, anaerobic regulatory protein [Ralstonia sp. 25mfcol4.1]